MFNKSYEATIEYLGSIAPSLASPTKFIKWAEDITDVIAFIYSENYDSVTEDIVAAAKEAQDYEDNED